MKALAVRAAMFFLCLLMAAAATGGWSGWIGRAEEGTKALAGEKVAVLIPDGSDENAETGETVTVLYRDGVDESLETDTVLAPDGVDESLETAIVRLPDSVDESASAEETVAVLFPDNVNESALAESYISGRLPRRRSVLRISRPSGLTRFEEGAPNRNLYLALRELVSEVAAGERTDTEFTFDAAELFSAQSYTAEDLGLETLMDEDQKITEEAKSAGMERITSYASELDITGVVYCVMTDSPYELYWFAKSFAAGRKLNAELTLTRDGTTSAEDESSPTEDETTPPGDGTTTAGDGTTPTEDELTNTGNESTNTEDEPSDRTSPDGDETTPTGNELLTIKITGTIKVTMYVSQDYADLTDWDESSGLTSVDTEKFGKVSAARENIQAILSEAAGMSDEEKINLYAQRICEMTSYNYEAVNKPLPYGDPWQLVWVFDGDPETKVVCEGYAKAFNYLCDMGTAETTAISCQGYLNQVSEASAHMWNIVRLNGHNYLVDLTNWDLGYDLFLVGAADGSVADGYTTRSGQKFIYRREYTPRSDEELTLASFDYAEWKAAIAAVPTVRISSGETWPGFAVALQVEGSVPVEGLCLTINEETAELPLEDGKALLRLEADAEIRFRAVIDGYTSPETESVKVTVAEGPEEASMTPPAGAVIEEYAFSGMGATAVLLRNSQVDSGAFAECPGLKYVWIQGDTRISPGAFDDDVILIVEDAGAWSETGYDFVVDVREN